MATEVSKRLFNVHEYHRMAAAGILREGDRVELIRGEILAMSPIGPRHNAAVMRANQALVRLVGDHALVGVQGSIRLGEYDEPQPDLYLLRPRADFYASGHAGPQDTLLIIEVSDLTLRYDETIKRDLYAETGVPEYWISDIDHDRVFLYSDIHEKSYRTVRQFVRGDSVTPILLPQCSIPVAALLP